MMKNALFAFAVLCFAFSENAAMMDDDSFRKSAEDTRRIPEARYIVTQDTFVKAEILQIPSQNKIIVYEGDSSIWGTFINVNFLDNKGHQKFCGPLNIRVDMTLDEMLVALKSAFGADKEILFALVKFKK